jgi:parvulin-like peptidyl-prolyl isomerase
MRGLLGFGFRLILSAAVLGSHGSICRAQGASESVVVAMVGAEAIRLREVDHLLEQITRGREVNPEAMPVLRAQILQEIIDRRLVLAYAQRMGAMPSAMEIEAAMARRKVPSAHESSVQDTGRQPSTSPEGIRRQVVWELTWQKLADRYITEEQAKAYFEAHRRELDGSELSVSHILLGLDANADRDGIDKLCQRAAELRRAITSGEISFEDAAREHSTAPTADDGGRLGFIPRHGAMTEAFSRAAFALDVGQVSDPVVTPFGVHLIRVNRIKPGRRPLTELRGEVQAAMGRELLGRLAHRERRHTSVEFTGASAYFKPGTQELALPD